MATKRHEENLIRGGSEKHKRCPRSGPRETRGSEAEKRRQKDDGPGWPPKATHVSNEPNELLWRNIDQVGDRVQTENLGTLNSGNLSGAQCRNAVFENREVLSFDWSVST